MSLKHVGWTWWNTWNKLTFSKEKSIPSKLHQTTKVCQERCENDHDQLLATALRGSSSRGQATVHLLQTLYCVLRGSNASLQAMTMQGNQSALQGHLLCAEHAGPITERSTLPLSGSAGEIRLTPSSSNYLANITVAKCFPSSLMRDARVGHSGDRQHNAVDNSWRVTFISVA